MERTAKEIQKEKEKATEKKRLHSISKTDSKHGVIIANGIHMTPKIVGASLQLKGKSHGVRTASLKRTGLQSVGTEPQWRWAH